MENALPVRLAVLADGGGDRSSPWDNTHEAPFFIGNSYRLGQKGDIQTILERFMDMYEHTFPKMATQ